jgi:hypothetical protein
MPVLNLDGSDEQIDALASDSESLEQHEEIVFRVSAVILFIAAVLMFVAQAKHGVGNGGSASNLPMLANIAIGIGLLRKQGFFNTSRNGFRIWAIVRSVISPIWLGYEVYQSHLSGLIVVPDTLLSLGLLCLLLDTSTSLTRVVIGATVSVAGLAGAVVLLVLI